MGSGKVRLGIVSCDHHSIGIDFRGALMIQIPVTGLLFYGLEDVTYKHAPRRGDKEHIPSLRLWHIIARAWIQRELGRPIMCLLHVVMTTGGAA